MTARCGLCGAATPAAELGPGAVCPACRRAKMLAEYLGRIEDRLGRIEDDVERIRLALGEIVEASAP